MKTISNDVLKEFKLITFKITKNNNSLFSIKLKVDAVICGEKQILIMKSIFFDELSAVLNTNICSININSDVLDDKIMPINDTDREIVNSFCNHFTTQINDNSFINFTIEPTIAFLINRYFYPSYFFKDPSFFSYFEESKFLESSSVDEIVQKIKNNKIKHFEINNFCENDFIYLRDIYTNTGVYYKLAIHLKTLYIFMIKMIIIETYSQKSYENEIIFCQNKFNHHCIVPFYGFVKKDDIIIGFVYEYMSNGDLSNFISKKQFNIFFSSVSVLRIFQGMHYLHSHSFIHRDIKPKNILLDHNNRCFIADFESLKNMDNDMTYDFSSYLYSAPETYFRGSVSFPADIYSFGQILYFLYEQKDMFEKMNYNEVLNKIKNNIIPSMDKIPDNVKMLCKECVNYESAKRPSIIKIKDDIEKMTDSFSCFDSYFLDDKSEEITNEMIQYFGEILLFDFEFMENDKFKQKINKLMVLLQAISKKEISQVLVQIGKLYSDGIIIKEDQQKAINYYKLSIKYNNPRAFFYLGKLYFNRKGANEDEFINLSIKYFKKAAKLKDIDSIFLLAKMYKNGNKTEKNYKKAIKYAQLGAKYNDSRSFNLLGLIYLHGIGVPIDYEKARQNFESAFKLNNLNAAASLGYIYQEGLGVKKNLENSKYYYEISAYKNNSIGLFNLGFLYETGEGNKKDMKKAVYYYKLSADMNYSQAQNNLGYIYMKGNEEIEKNYDEAIRYFKLSSENGNDFAYNNLGEIYKEGLGVTKDYLRAKYYFECAIKQNNSDAYFNLGEFYFKGNDKIKKNIPLAIQYYESAAKSNHQLALYKLGIIYFEGKVIEKNFEKARSYFISAIMNNDIQSIFYLGLIYFKGFSVERNFFKSFYYFSNEQNNLNSYYYLGLSYENGLGIKKDISKAIFYYFISCNTKSINFVYSFKKGLNKKELKNDFFYQSYNNLGLIYILDKNKQFSGLAKEYIGVAAYAEFSFGQNNLGLIYQYFYSNEKEAERFFELSAKNKFDLAEFNLGNLLEKKGENEKAFMHYNKVIDYENEPLFFQHLEREDEVLAVSKIFINCLTYLKIINRNFTNPDNIYANVGLIIKLIFRMLLKLLFQYDNKTYILNAQIIVKNFNNFILQYPMFYHQNNVATKIWEIVKNKEKIQTIIISDICFMDKKYYNINEILMKFVNENEEKIEKQFNFDHKTNDLNNKIMNTNIFKDGIDKGFKKIFDDMNQNNMFKSLIINKENEKIKVTFTSYDNIKRTLEFPQNLDIIILNNLTILRKEIKKTIQSLDKILFTYPYEILFGRINFNSKKNEDQIKNIGKSFWNGFGLDIDN